MLRDEDAMVAPLCFCCCSSLSATKDIVFVLDNLSLQHKNIFSKIYTDLPLVSYIQMKARIGICPLRPLENDKLLAFTQFKAVLRTPSEIINRGSNNVICH